MVSLGELGDSEGTGIPDGDKVVVASGSKLGTIRSPLEAANFRGVGNKLCNLVFGNTDIVVVDESTSSTSREKVLVPAHNTNTGVMTEHAANLLTLSNIPNLDLTGSKTNTDISTVARPLNTADIRVRACLQQAAHGAFISRPDIDRALKTNSNLVARAPVEQVQVVVINQTGSVKNTLGSSGNATSKLGRVGIGSLKRTVVLLTKINRLRRLRRSRLELKDTGVKVDAASIGQGVLVGDSVGRWTSVVSLFILIDVKAL